MKEEYKCPCEEVDPQHFITNEEVKWLLDNQDKYEFKQDDYYRVYNCIHCNECGTAEERFILKQKFLEDGNKIEGLEDTIKALEMHGTPFIKNKSRVKVPRGVPKESKTLLYLGCFTTVKTPKYSENIINYLLKKGVEFTILDEEICCGYPILCNGSISEYNKLVEKNDNLFKERGYQRIITACPSCYMTFKKKLKMDIHYFTEYLTPSQLKKEGNLVIQHACPLKNGAILDIVKDTEELYRKSGYTIIDSVPNECCGGGVGHQLRIDVSEAIAMKRMDSIIEKAGSIISKTGTSNYITTYCPDAYWILKVFGRKKKIGFKLKNMCELLM